LSHIVTVKTEVRDAAAIQAACLRLGLALPIQGKAELFSGEVEGWAIQLPGWHYPVVADTATGKLHFDNFQGRWGNEKHLNKFLQMYAVEKAKIEARKKGHTVAEQQLPDGSIKLSVQIAGGAAW
jgi:hypothetical protein